MSNETVLEVIKRVRDYLDRHADLVDHEPEFYALRQLPFPR